MQLKRREMYKSTKYRRRSAHVLMLLNTSSAYVTAASICLQLFPPRIGETRELSSGRQASARAGNADDARGNRTPGVELSQDLKAVLHNEFSTKLYTGAALGLGHTTSLLPSCDRTPPRNHGFVSCKQRESRAEDWSGYV